MGAPIGVLKTIAVHPYRLPRAMQAFRWGLPMDITLGGAVAGFAAKVWQMEHHIQTFLALVREWGLGKTPRPLFPNR